MTNTSKRTIVIGAIVIGLAVFAGFAIRTTRANLTAQVVVENFYRSWMESATRAPNAPLEARLHHKSTYVTEAFGRSVDIASERGKDAVLCLGTAPTTLTFSPAVVNEMSTRGSVSFTADNASGRALVIRDDRGWWRIDEVDCTVDLSPGLPPKVIETGTTTATTTATTTE